MGHDDVGHHARLEARHAIAQHHSWHAVQFGEALGQQLECGLARMSACKAHLAIAGLGQRLSYLESGVRGMCTPS